MGRRNILPRNLRGKRKAGKLTGEIIREGKGFFKGGVVLSGLYFPVAADPITGLSYFWVGPGHTPPNPTPREDLWVPLS